MRVYRNDDLIIYWRPEFCAHVSYCVRGLPEVFNSHKRPWINIDGAPALDIIKVVDTCPTGALKYALPPGSSIRPEQAAGPGSVNYKDETTVVKIKVLDNGPLLLEGPAAIYDQSGLLIKKADRMSLCRCGHTSNPPFCDGSHRADIRAAKHPEGSV